MTMRRTRLVALLGAIAMLASGCLCGPNASRYAASPSMPAPWWCTSGPGPALGVTDCKNLSIQLDLGLAVARAHPYVLNAVADGATGSAYEPGVGAAFRFSGPTASFKSDQPDTVLYDGTGPGAKVVGLEWNVSATSAPAGFIGTSDVWTSPRPGVWRLRAWFVRPFENQVDPFAATHPCLGTTAATYDLTAGCYTSTHPRPFRILVTNDDGFRAPGIDATVQALRTLPNVDITVVAPATNQSGSGDKTTPGGVTANPGTTLSGYPVTAVNGFPADSVLYALNTQHVNPDLVVSGINEGQNPGPLASISGTVGAARTGSRAYVPSVAVSQGLGSPPDFPSGAAALLAWVRDFRLGRAGPPFQEVANINVPTCSTGTIRGTRVVPSAASFDGRRYDPSDCTSTVTNLRDDVDAFLNGFIAVSDVGRG